MAVNHWVGGSSPSRGAIFCYMRDKVMHPSDGGKIGFWALISMVVGAQLGASIFLLPSVLAPFRSFGLLAWITSGLGAVFITVIFADLCIQTGKQGGPHVYAQKFFGKKIGFFVTWIYWWVSWACNPIMIATAINYLMSFTGDLSIGYQLSLEILLVVSLTLINTHGVRTAGAIEIVLTVLKVLPLIIIPIIALQNINFENFSIPVSNGMSPLESISKATLIAFWSFVGLEGGTAPAEFVEKPERTIPLAIIVGTSFVALICLINTVSIFGIISPAELESVGAPFAHIMTVLFGGGYEKAIGLMTFVMCAGSLNAWVLFSGHIARSAASEKIFPAVFKKLNKKGAPSTSLWISALGTILLLFLQKTSLASKLDEFVSMSVIIYVMLYVTAIAALIKFMIQSRKSSVRQYITTVISLLFCLFLIFNSDIESFVALGIMIASGIPVYLFSFRNKKV